MGDQGKVAQVHQDEELLTLLYIAESPDDTEQTLSVMVITDVVRQLSDEHRSAIYETYVMGRTVKEAAIVLGVPEGTVKSRLYKAMHTIRRALQDRS